MSAKSARYGELNARIGAEIRRRRKARDLSTRDVEAVIGVANNTISKLENGEQNITPKYLELFAGFFGCEPRDLLPDEPEWTRLRDAVGARDAHGVVEALAELGVVLPRTSPDPGDPTAVPGDVASLAARQIRASAESMEAAISGLRHAADALDSPASD